MAKIQGLQKRGERFHLRIRVPRDLISYYNKQEIKKSLNTDDYSKAKRRCIKERAVLEIDITYKIFINAPYGSTSI